MNIVKHEIKKVLKISKLPLKVANRIGNDIYWKAANASLSTNLQARIERIICKH